MSCFKLNGREVLYDECSNVFRGGHWERDRVNKAKYYFGVTPRSCKEHPFVLVEGDVIENHRGVFVVDSILGFANFDGEVSIRFSCVQVPKEKEEEFREAFEGNGPVLRSLHCYVSFLNK